MNEVEVSVRFVRDFGEWKAGDTTVLKVDDFRRLYAAGVVEPVGFQRFIEEVAKLAYLEMRDTEPQELPDNFYDKVKLIEEVLTARLLSGDVTALDKLKRFKNHVKKLKMTRLEKIFYRALLRPNSLEIENKLTREERELYKKWSLEIQAFLGGVGNE